MRILDVENNKTLKKANIYLTRSEAQELLDDLTTMIENKEKAFHVHVDDVTYEHEITLAIYEENDLTSFDDRSKKIIEYDA